MGSLSGKRTILNAGIAVRDLGTEDTGADETQGCKDCKHNNMLVASPRERQGFRAVLQEEHESDRADYQKQGDKHRR